MAEYNCKDINGNDIKQFVFGDDGVVYGVSGYENLETNYKTTVPYEDDSNLSHLSLECCNSIGQTYDSNYGKCYHRIDDDVDVKIVFNVDNYNGLVFTRNEGERCGLQLSFDLLVEYDSDIVFPLIENGTQLLTDLLKGLDLSVLIEKQINQESNGDVIYEGAKTLKSIFEEKIYKVKNFTENTGIVLSGTKTDLLNNKLEDELGVGYTPSLLNGSWIKINLTIDDDSVINTIVNEEVKFSILVNENPVDFSILMDNIKFTKTSEIEYVERKTIDKSPSFEMVKVVDNKKSWTDDVTERKFDLPLRDTDYVVDEDKMILNSKEIELSTSVFDTIENDVVEFVKNNLDLLTGDSGASEKYKNLDITTLLSNDVTPSSSNIELLRLITENLVDVKSRKTIIGYPVLELLYERYLNSETYDTPSSNKFTYGQLSTFIEMLGNYWVELIEQMIPSTTIWSSSHKIGSSRFRPNKFNYKRYNLRFNHKNNDYFIVRESGLGVIASEVTKKHPTKDFYNDIYIKAFSNGGVNIGNVGIVGSGDNNNNTINEN
jgi:hypothetical protein